MRKEFQDRDRSHYDLIKSEKISELNSKLDYLIELEMENGELTHELLWFTYSCLSIIQCFYTLQDHKENIAKADSYSLIFQMIEIYPQ